MFSIQFRRSLSIRMVLAIALGLTEFPLRGNCILTDEKCFNVTGEIICYFKGSQKTEAWDKARQLCISLGSTLPIIRNRNDQDALAGYLASHMDTDFAWTQGSNASYKIWTWLNEEQLKKITQGRFEEHPGLHCEDVYGAFDTDFKFIALCSSDELPYICQYAGAYCNSSKNILVIDKCLRFSVDNRTWYDARNQCLMGGGDLAIIDDVDQMLAKTLSLNQSYWIGLRKTFWRWTINDDAKSIEEIKYTNWNEEIFSKEGECIVIEISSGKWKALGCNELHAVVCRKGEVTISASSTDTSLEDTKTEVESFTCTSVSENSSTSGSQAFAVGVVGAVILIIVCVIAIIVFAMRTANRSVIELFQSEFNNSSTRNRPTHEELYDKTTHAPVNTSVSVPLYASLKRSDNDYDEITSTIIQLESDATNQQPGFDEEFLKCQKEFIKLEPDTKDAHTTVPNKIGPLGDIYAMPDAKSRAVTSPTGGSNSHPIIVTAKGDIYALPTKTSKLSTANQPGEVFYANLQTEMLGKKEKTEDHCQTKEIGHSNSINSSPHNNSEESRPISETVNAPEKAPVTMSEDIRDIAPELPLLSLNQSKEGKINQQPGIVNASIEDQHKPTYMEYDRTQAQITDPTKTGLLGDKSDTHDAKGISAIPLDGTSRVSDSQSIKVTLKALPLETAKSSTANDSREVVYANDSREVVYANDSREIVYANDLRVTAYANNSKEVAYANDSREVAYANDSREVAYANDSREVAYANLQTELLDKEHKTEERP